MKSKKTKTEFIKVKTTVNLKQVLQNNESVLNTGKESSKNVEQERKKKIKLLTTSLLIGYNQIRSLDGCQIIFTSILSNA